MAQFKTALRIEVSNAVSACSNAHKEYNALKREVASNVNSRKQVFISTLLITCYVDNITSNSSAKACADRKRRASTSQWNINAGSLARCPSKAHLTNSMGPAGWKPTVKSCTMKHWHNAAHVKENKAKEVAAKKPAKLTCATRSSASNRAGVVRVMPHGGYVMTGGGMNNRYRSWNAKSAFEDMYPEGGQGGAFRCDTGFGPGHLTCYTRSCKVDRGSFHCTTRSASKKGSGIAVATLPRGYTMTGGGLYNHYRHFNARAGFEESMPHGNDGWRGDMGFGWGHFQVFVRGCKASKGNLSCVTRKTTVGNYHTANCPGGYQLTGCGINNHYRSWNKLSGFEASQPHGNNCVCDSGFGTGRNTCYARCCKIV